MSALFLATGNCYLGRKTTDENGNVIKETPPRFEYADNGSCIVISELDPKTMDPIGAGEVYGDFNASAYLERVLEILEPVRGSDIPNFKEIILSALENQVDICEYCKNMDCKNCIVNDWKGEYEQNEM
jgi:hypothetical protein